MTRSIAVLAASVALLSLPLVSEAQTSRPGVDCSLLTASQAQGLVCANSQKPDLPDDPSCVDVNPYRDPEKADACGKRPNGPDREPVFEIGKTYYFGYSQLKAVVIGLARDPQGIQVVTLAWLPESLTDGVLAVRTPPAPGGRSPWTKVQ